MAARTWAFIPAPHQALIAMSTADQQCTGCLSTESSSTLEEVQFLRSHQSLTVHSCAHSCHAPEQYAYTHAPKA